MNKTEFNKGVSELDKKYLSRASLLEKASYILSIFRHVSLALSLASLVAYGAVKGVYYYANDIFKLDSSLKEVKKQLNKETVEISRPYAPVTTEYGPSLDTFVHILDKRRDLRISLEELASRYDSSITQLENSSEYRSLSTKRERYSKQCLKLGLGSAVSSIILLVSSGYSRAKSEDLETTFWTERKKLADVYERDCKSNV